MTETMPKSSGETGQGQAEEAGGLLRRPRQSRSEQSLRRILDAAERIMERKDFSEMTIQEIAREAHSSVGVFYSRFPDKMALLHVLDERFVSDAEADVGRLVRENRWGSLAEAVHAVVRFVWQAYARKKGMQRSIIMQVRLTPSERFQASGRRLVGTIAVMGDLLMKWSGEIRHPDPEGALRLGLTLVVAAVKEMVVFSRTTFLDRHAPPAEEAMISALAEFWLSYLGDDTATEITIDSTKENT